MHGSFPSFLASWATMTATMLLTAAPAAARYAHGRVAAGLLFALSYLAVWGSPASPWPCSAGRTAPSPPVPQPSPPDSMS